MDWLDVHLDPGSLLVLLYAAYRWMDSSSRYKSEVQPRLADTVLNNLLKNRLESWKAQLIVILKDSCTMRNREGSARWWLLSNGLVA
jgi:hypothetical protein